MILSTLFSPTNAYLFLWKIPLDIFLYGSFKEKSVLLAWSYIYVKKLYIFVNN